MKNNLTEIVLDAEIPTFDLKEKDWYCDNYQAVKGDFSQIYIKQYGVFKYKEYFKEDFFNKYEFIKADNTARCKFPSNSSLLVIGRSNLL